MPRTSVKRTAERVVARFPSGRVVVVGAVVAALSVGTVSITAVLAAKAALAAPTLSTKPANPTNSTSASFAFASPGATSYQCKLDAAAFATCTSPKSYAGPLAAGSHTFQVRAVAGSETALTSYSWTIDLTPPAPPTITAQPASLSNTSSPSFSFTAAESSVSFRCALDAGAFATCSSPKAYSGLAQGAHTFRVLSVDAAGNTSAAVSRSWQIDSIAPSAPVITQKPSDPTTNATNTFAWTATEAGLTFQCSAENGSWNACSSPYTYVINTKNNQQHQFSVRGVDAAGNTSAAASYSFKYDKLQPESGVPFTISGSASGLTLGAWTPVSVVVTNPNTAAIYVKALAVTASADSTPPGCSRQDNLEIEQSDVSATQWLLVPAGGSVALPAQGRTAPRIRLKNLPTVNQDVCKNKSFALSFTGTASN